MNKNLKTLTNQRCFKDLELTTSNLKIGEGPHYTRRDVQLGKLNLNVNLS